MAQEQGSCPHCGQPAPVVHRGLLTYCAACGQPRAPFTASSVTLAGQPSKVGGTIAAVLGWLVLGGGGLIAVTVGVLLQALFPVSAAGYVIGGMIGLVSLGMALALLFSGRSLRRLGVRTAENVRDQAILALAAHKGGVLTARDVSLALGSSLAECDAMLTELTTRDQAVLEVDDDGRMTYRFPQVLPLAQQRWPAAEGARVAVDARPGDTQVAGPVADVLEDEPPAETAGRAKAR